MKAGKLACTLCLISTGLSGAYAQLQAKEQAHPWHLSVYANTQAHSPAAPITHWFNGFSTAPKAGDYAFANSRIGMFAQYQNWHIGIERRRYDYLSFNRDTLSFYYALEQSQTPPQNSRLSLNVQSLNAKGAFLGYQFTHRQQQLRLRLYYYQINDYQFGQLSGLTGSTQRVSATANVDYIFSQDKLLAYPAKAQAGYGLSSDIRYLGKLTKHWQMQLHLQDVLNQIRIEQAGFTRGCINVGQPATPVCHSIGAGSGRSGHQRYRTQIPLSADLTLSYRPYQLELGAFQHQKAKWVSVAKQFSYQYQGTQQIKIGLTSLPSMILSWHYKGIKLAAEIDDYRTQHLHHLGLQLGYSLSW